MAVTPPPEQTLDTNAPLPGRGGLLAGGRKWAILAVGVLVLVTAFVFWRQQTPPADQTNTVTTNTTNTPTPRQNTSPTFQQVTVPIVVDSDKDGLTDQREAELKTNPALADTDGDELSDYEEATVYGTNPLAQDTDTDGFPDGVEVQTGNNPKGTGKIINLPESISNINTQ